MNLTQLNSPTLKTKILSITSIITFLGALAGGAYGFSIAEDKISDIKFTISQALAFGNKYVMVIGFAISYLSLMYLNYLRKGPYVRIRFLLITLIFSFLITIIWETTYANEGLHYRLAGVIFLSDLIFIGLINYIYHKYLKDENSLGARFIDLTVFLTYTSFVMLVVFGIFAEDTKTEEEDKFFAANEIIVAFLTLIPIYYLGFI